MKSITFHGASGTVTGSSYLLQKDSKRGILIDLGMYQGTAEVAALNTDPLHFDARELDGVLLTHAHLDHCGRLPLLAKNGFTGKVFMTEPTLDMLEVVLMDAARIAQYDEKIPVLYTEADVQNILQRVEVVDFDEPFSCGGFKVTYKEAGHIIGAASLLIEDTQSTDDVRKIVFSGDIGNFPHMMLPDPHMFDEADVVIMESTYGGRVHPHVNPIDGLIEEIKAAEQDKSVLMIPSFAIERTQELLYLLKRIKDDAKILLGTPVFLDSPMAIKITEIYRRYGALYNDDFHQALSKFDPFNFNGLQLLEKSKDGKKIDKELGAKIIIAGSGMMSGGRILRHAAKYLPNSKNRLLFIGYQGEETTGRLILEGAPEVTIAEKTIPVKAHISQIESMSAHADENQLVEWLGHMHGVKKLFLTHGEDDAREALSKKVSSELSLSDITMPQLYDEVGLI